MGSKLASPHPGSHLAIIPLGLCASRHPAHLVCARRSRSHLELGRAQTSACLWGSKQSSAEPEFRLGCVSAPDTSPVPPGGALRVLPHPRSVASVLAGGEVAVLSILSALKGE